MSAPTERPSPEPFRPLAFCRDCFRPARPGATRCGTCGSPRLLAHPELDRLAIAHVDCDAFYASIEKRDDPSLQDKPVIVGGGKRGVVATACYIARIHGVRSAMPMWQALERCPNAVVIRPDMAKYTRVGREIRALMGELTPLVEPLSIDEAFLDLSGTELVHHGSPATTLARFAKRVETQIGISLSVGLSHNKFLAKIASDLDKPRGFSVIGKAETADFLAPRPVTTIWGVGRATAEALNGMGLRTIADLRRAEESDLFRRFGVLGRRLKELADGVDRRVVDPSEEIKSISNELTLDTDVADFRELEKILFRLSTKVSGRLKASGHGGFTVQLKLKTPDFKGLTRNRRLADPTALADRIFRTAADLLRRETDGRRFRLIGVGVADLTPLEFCDPPDLVDEGAGRRAKAEAAIDDLRRRFGADVVEQGLVFTPRPKPSPKGGDQGQDAAGNASSDDKSARRTKEP
ncbi:MAG: DNA polymerase IV [Hyphomicrobiales bacterium]|nr:DNA polymerase IV [Hyphomicrobiales bacterium]